MDELWQLWWRGRGVFVNLRVENFRILLTAGICAAGIGMPLQGSFPRAFKQEISVAAWLMVFVVAVRASQWVTVWMEEIGQ